MLQDVLQASIELWHNRGTIQREDGAHASGGGWCHKKAILEAVYPEMKEDLSVDTKTIFQIGHDIHDRFDEMLRLYCRENSNYMWIQPWRLFTMSKVMKDAYIETGAKIEESPIPLGVFGTPDGVIIDVNNGKLIVPDFKSSNERAFSFKVKGSRSFTHEVQLGAYLPGITGLLNKAGFSVEIGEAVIVYINKSNWSLCSHSYDPILAEQSAASYWEDFAAELGKFVKSGGIILPPASPPEKWMCNYCSMFKNKAECNDITDIDQFLNSSSRASGTL